MWKPVNIRFAEGFNIVILYDVSTVLTSLQLAACLRMRCSSASIAALRKVTSSSTRTILVTGPTRPAHKFGQHIRHVKSALTLIWNLVTGHE